MATIMTLKEVLGREGGSRGADFTVFVGNYVFSGAISEKFLFLLFLVEYNEKTTVQLLSKIHPKVEGLLEVANQYRFIDALKEIQVQENDVSFLSPNWMHILENSEKITFEYNSQPKQLEHVYSTKNFFFSLFPFFLFLSQI